MQRHDKYIPHGVIPAVILPFDNDLAIDEAGPRPTRWLAVMTHGRTWGKKGETPVVETTGARHSMSLISAITARGHMRIMIKDKGGVNAEIFIEFLKRLITGAKVPSF